jgi:hypothetical protein
MSATTADTKTTATHRSQAACRSARAVTNRRNTPKHMLPPNEAGDDRAPSNCAKRTHRRNAPNEPTVQGLKATKNVATKPRCAGGAQFLRNEPNLIVTNCRIRSNARRFGTEPTIPAPANGPSQSHRRSVLPNLGPHKISANEPTAHRQNAPNEPTAAVVYTGGSVTKPKSGTLDTDCVNLQVFDEAIRTGYVALLFDNRQSDQVPEKTIAECRNSVRKPRFNRTFQ